MPSNSPHAEGGKGMQMTSWARHIRWWASNATTTLAIGVLGAALSPGARALDEPPDEMDKLKACEKRICTMILGKQPTGDDFKCDAQKTWAKSSLKEGESKGVSWGFGDARCNATLKLSRADIVNALTLPKYTIKIPPQTVKCVVERDQQLKPVLATLAPKLEFKDGKANKVWINLKDLSGPDDIKSTLWTAAKLEDTLGIFHRPMIKQINKFMHQQCAKKYGPGGSETAEAKAKEEKEKKAKEAANAKSKVVTPAAAATVETPAPANAPAADNKAAASPPAKPAASEAKAPEAKSEAKDAASGR